MSALLLVLLAGAPDPARGEQLYIARCGACHSLDEHGAGPKHRGLFGRKAGSEPGFEYSEAHTSPKVEGVAR
jgi:cytochrome c